MRNADNFLAVRPVLSHLWAELEELEDCLVHLELYDEVKSCLEIDHELECAEVCCENVIDLAGRLQTMFERW